MDVQTDVQMYKISPHPTGPPPLLRLLPKKGQFGVENGRIGFPNGKVVSFKNLLVKKFIWKKDFEKKRLEKYFQT